MDDELFNELIESIREVGSIMRDEKKITIETLVGKFEELLEHGQFYTSAIESDGSGRVNFEEFEDSLLEILGQYYQENDREPPEFLKMVGDRLERK